MIRHVFRTSPRYRVWPRRTIVAVLSDVLLLAYIEPQRTTHTPLANGTRIRISAIQFRIISRDLETRSYVVARNNALWPLVYVTFAAHRFSREMRARLLWKMVDLKLLREPPELARITFWRYLKRPWRTR